MQGGIDGQHDIAKQQRCFEGQGDYIALWEDIVVAEDMEDWDGIGNFGVYNSGHSVSKDCYNDTGQSAVMVGIEKDCIALVIE